MTQKHTPPSPDLTADPYEIEIGGLVIFHRAALLPHDAAARKALVEAANDYFWYAHLLEKLGGKSPPWDRRSKNEAMPPEVFFETAEWIGLSQTVPSPSIGVEQRHFRLSPRAGAANSRFHPSPKKAGSIAVVELIKHPDLRWQVLHAEVSPAHRRQGIATLLYDRIEAIIGAKLRPSGWLSEDAYRLWEGRGCWFLPAYRQMEHLPGLWISPKAILCLRDIALAQTMDWSEGTKPN